MKLAIKLSTPALAAFALFVMALPPANAQSPESLKAEPASSDPFDIRHEACLEQVTKDAELGYEEALIWKGDGGGRRARHCIAMALFALGHEEDAASRLQEMGGEIRTGTPSMRADWLTEAADFWLAADKPKEAYDASSQALKTVRNHLGARLTRARAYAQLERWDYAEVDLTSALVMHPGDVQTLRYRADVRRRLGKLDEALADIDHAMRADPMSVESAKVRGDIREAIRLKGYEE